MNTVKDLIEELKNYPEDAIVIYGDKTLIGTSLNDIDERDKIEGKSTVSLYFRKYLINGINYANKF